MRFSDLLKRIPFVDHWNTNLHDAANIFAFMGGALVGWPLRTALAGGDAQWV